MARLARKHAIHYANLTEHVKETEEILEIADGAEQGFLLQTGLAPGYIDVLGHLLFQGFCRQHGVDSVDCPADARRRPYDHRPAPSLLRLHLELRRRRH